METPTDCDAAEEQLASLAVAVNRLPAGSFVRSGVEAALAELRSAVDARRAALGAPTPTPAAALALDARSLLARSLDACDAAHRPATNFEAAACAVHALLRRAELSSRRRRRRRAVGGFAPAARALPWTRACPGAGAARAAARASATAAARTPSSPRRPRGELQISPRRRRALAWCTPTASPSPTAARPRAGPALAAFEALAAYVAGTVVPAQRRARRAPAAAAPRAPPRPAAPAVVPGFAPAAPRRPQPFGDPLATTAGPARRAGPPAFGAATAHRGPLSAAIRPRRAPRAGLPGGAPRAGAGAPPGPGEPDFDHARPGLDDGPGGGFI
ncbi:hypothetical protein JL722_11118 [Aureococcus anophagefferens]|nr:hypothetical protein JL722_11118 [Aureococcus anophagefferens]